MAELFDWPMQEVQRAAKISRDRGRQVAAPDWREREQALDISKSWIVEAPAGSGKTGLLIQRYLKLLAEGEVDRPEQVLAITFTRAATEEIRERVMSELEAAAAGTGVRGVFERTTRDLAKGVLRRDTERRWGLLQAPGRLNVRTIDSVCGEIAGALPVTNGGSAGVTPVENAGALYREAGRRTVLQLGGSDALLDEALRTVLLHRDGNLGDCERLIAEMLVRREQWGELVPLGAGELTEEALEETVRPRLDAALELVICRGLTGLVRSLEPEFLERLTEAAAEMGDRPGYRDEISPIEICRTMRSAPEAKGEHLAHWRALIHLLVTPSSETWRKRFNINEVGFATSRADKQLLTDLIFEVQHRPDLLDALCQVKTLPPAKYPDEQWNVAKALFRVLSRSLVELQLVFAERGECDFAEPALLARAVLRQEHGMESFEAAVGLELRHLLVDEMQDTSTSQYELIELLTAGWNAEGRTVFLVGDPKQSIYLFRQARVERFVQSMRSERLGDLRLKCLRLTANFRSQAGLVGGFNADFAQIFAQGGEGYDDVPFVAAQAVRPRSSRVAGDAGLSWHPAQVNGAQEDLGEGKRRLVRRNAKDIREIIERWRSRPLPAGRGEPWRLAVLVSSRRELREIVAALKRDEGSGGIPFRAVKVEPLNERREVLDLLALTRALLHPADRAAWWAVLRAPWCGLSLADLHILAGEDDARFSEATVLDLLAERGGLLGAEGISRLERIWHVLEVAAGKRSSLRHPELVERTWRSLGGDAALPDAELSNAVRFLQLLDEMERETGSVDIGQIDSRTEGLYAAARTQPGAVDLMTIHGAKGLEWDVVIVPELERRAPPTRSRLLDWEEVAGGAEVSAAVVLAPISGKGQDSAALNTWLRGIRSARESAERRRLFYVACTRAREELHLFGTANVLQGGQVKAERESLLEAAWPAAKSHFGPETETIRPAQLSFEGLALAAAAEEEQEIERPALLERFPASFDPLARLRGHATLMPEHTEEMRARFDRPEGSFAARSFGNAVHTFLEFAARGLATGQRADELLDEVPGWKQRVRAVLRGDGLPPDVVERLATRVIAAVAATVGDATGQWLLGARVDARSEYALTAWDEGWRRLRMDRVFRAGAVPGAAGSEQLWIVDYKTGAHAAEGVEAFLEAEKVKYAGQMEQYARATGEREVRLALWYPMVKRLVWWVASE